MSKQQRDAIDAALRAEPFGLSQSTAEHRKSFDAFALRPYPADVAAADVDLGGVGAIELTVAGNAAGPHCAVFPRWRVRRRIRTDRHPPGGRASQAHRWPRLVC